MIGESIEYLDKIATEEGTDKSTKARGRHGYTVHYERHFEHLRDTPIRLLEIGIADGGSVRTWKRYFPLAEIHGLDNWQDVRRPGDLGGITVWTGNQADTAFLQDVVAGGDFDIIIDDGSHNAADVRASFEFLWPHVRPGGWYVIEDLHCSYHPRFCAGLSVAGSQAELLKRLIDRIHERFHGWQHGGKKTFEAYGLGFQVPEILPPSDVAGLHVYERIAFIEKAAQ